MSDVLIVGRDPKSDAGKEYFLHCGDWWWDIVELIANLLSDRFSFDRHFVREVWLAPPTPRIDAATSYDLADHVEKVVLNGDAEVFLRTLYREDRDIDEDEEVVEGYIEQRIEQIKEFVLFLRNCGGCQAKWWNSENNK